MSEDTLELKWEQSSATTYLYFYGRTMTRFSVQIGQSSIQGGFMWMIFHEDFLGAVYGEEVPSVEEGKAAAQQWLYVNAKRDRA